MTGPHGYEVDGPDGVAFAVVEGPVQLLVEGGLPPAYSLCVTPLVAT